MEHAHGAQLARRDARAGLQGHRVVAVHERDRGHAPRGGGRVGEAGGLLRVERERLLADDVLAGGERGLGERSMQVVRRAQVDDVHLRRLHELLGGLVRARGAQLDRGLARALRARRAHAGDLRPGDPCGPRVDRADEAGAHDPGVHRPAPCVGEGKRRCGVLPSLLHPGVTVPIFWHLSIKTKARRRIN